MPLPSAKGKARPRSDPPVAPVRPQAPAWAGPETDGVSFSMLSRYLADKERFRVMVVEGLKTRDTFRAPIEYGHMWHVMEEALARGSPGTGLDHAEAALGNYARTLMDRYPLDREKVAHWSAIASNVFPDYARYWAEHPFATGLTAVEPEQVFDVRRRLPSGREVRLRGKRDGLTAIGSGREAGVYLRENKTKSSIDPQAVTRQLTFDLQTMLYLITLPVNGKGEVDLGSMKVGGRRSLPLRGVWYNVVLRPAHKIIANMVKKLDDDLEAGRAGEWFARWQVDVTPGDLARFARECLDPVLENLCDDYEWWSRCKTHPRDRPLYDVFDGTSRSKRFPHHTPHHFRFPFGVWNPLTEGAETDLDEYLRSGSEAGLVRTTNFFPELE